MVQSGKRFASPAPTHIAGRDVAWPWPHFLYFFLGVWSCQMLVLAIQYGNGYYNAFSLELLLFSVGLWLLLIPLLFWAASASRVSTRQPQVAAAILPVAALLILQLVLGLQDPYIYYNQIPLYPTFARGVVWIVILLALTYIPDGLKLAGWAGLAPLLRYRFPLLVGLSLGLKFATVFASHINLIDVGIMMQDSSANLLAGRNPFTSPTAGYTGFNYLPMHLLLPLPFYVLFGDTRFGSAILELVGVVFMYRLAHIELGSARLVRLAELVLLLFLWQPRGLFVIEQAWGEPLAVGAAGAAFYFFYRRPAGPLADILLAVLLMVKQYLVYMAFPVAILYGLNWKRYAITGLVCLLIALPFFLWDPAAFYERNVLHFFGLPIQTTSLSLTSYFWERGVLIPRWVSPLASGLVMLGSSLLLRRFGLLGYLHTVILTLLCLFLFGQQAFANYYYLLAFFQAANILFFLLYTFGRTAQPDVGLAIGGSSE